MEQTRRDTVIELLCAGHSPAAIIKLLKYPRRTVYDITKKWEESGMSKRKEHKPRSDRICTPHICGWSQEVHQGQSGDAHVHPRQEAWGPPVVVPWMDFDSAPAHTAKLVQSWLKKNVPNFWDFNTWPPNSPDLNPSDYYLWGKLEREVYATHHSNMASLKASISRR
ncbi:Transposable element tcb2 transposase [Caligus rogercresseyi]|uniref:Transposable element tcb2 transposase n=1 Tax=Caligus rogercresseyi TaxID=217165 RepID=A0A7T8GU32_CALRO|nr:Transposable element tcb2 transposase [Caligus rogercresseyi]